MKIAINTTVPSIVETIVADAKRMGHAVFSVEKAETSDVKVEYVIETDAFIVTVRKYKYVEPRITIEGCKGFRFELKPSKRARIIRASKHLTFIESPMFMGDYAIGLNPRQYRMLANNLW